MKGDVFRVEHKQKNDGDATRTKKHASTTCYTDVKMNI